MKVFQLVSSDYQMWLLLLAAAFFIPMGVFIYRYSEDPLLSWITFSTVFYTFFAFSAMRQALALSVSVFMGFHFVRKRRLTGFLLLVFAAYTIHKSAIIFLPFYVLYSVPFSKRAVALYGIAAAAALLFGNQVMVLVGDVFEEYAHYAAEGYVGSNTLLYAAVLIVFSCLLRWRWDGIKAQEPENAQMAHALACSLAVIPLAFLNSNAFRAIYYYMIFLLLLLPTFTCSFSEKESSFVGCIAVVAMLVFMLFLGPVNDGADYRFFWM